MSLADVVARVAQPLRAADALRDLPGGSPARPLRDAWAFAHLEPWELTQHFADRLGPIGVAWLGPMPLVMLHDPELIGRVLIDAENEGAVYKAEPIPALRPITPPNTSTFVQNGAEHRRGRAASFAAHPSYRAWLDETAASLVELAARRAGADLAQPDLGERVFRFMFDAFARALIGVELGDAAYEDAWTVFRTIDLRLRTNLPVYGPRFFGARRRWWGAFRARVQAHRAGRESGGMLAHMLPGCRVSLDQFAIGLAATFPSGYFSTTSALLNALASIASAPDVHRELRAAIREDARRGGAIDAQRLADVLPLERTVREALRLHPPVPILMRRVGRRPLRLAGYELPPHTAIAIGPGPIHHSKEWWGQPTRFAPSRWTAERLAERGYGSETFFPFGRGARECEGGEVALTMIRAVLYGLLSVGGPQLDPGEQVRQRFFFAVMMPRSLRGRIVVG